jgi:hypothetical protein
MKTNSDPAIMRYAIIEAMRCESAPEHFVISYRSEQSLRQVIAASCIVATGFISRAEALENCGVSLSLVA